MARKQIEDARDLRNAYFAARHSRDDVPLDEAFSRDATTRLANAPGFILEDDDDVSCMNTHHIRPMIS